MKKISILFLMELVIGSGFSQTLKFRFTFDNTIADAVSAAELVPGVERTIGGVTYPATTAVYGEGKYGQAIVLSGTGDLFDFNSGALVNPQTESLTACAWVYNTVQTLEPLATGYDEEQVIHINKQRVILQASLTETESNVGSWVGGAAAKSTVTTCFVRNEWQHIAVVTDPVAKTHTFFVNGVQMGDVVNIPATQTWSPGGTGYRIGAHQLGDRSFWHGKLDEVCLFQGALTAEQITKVMNNDYNVSSVNPTFANDQIRVYPNPAKDNINVEGIENVTAMTLITLDGRKVLSTGKTASIAIPGIASGNYLLKIELNDGSFGYKKVMVL